MGSGRDESGGEVMVILHYRLWWLVSRLSVWEFGVLFVKCRPLFPESGFVSVKAPI